MKTYTVTEDEDGNICWYSECGQYHREDGPAIEYADGTKEWWINGELHREDGPAIEWANGYRAWCINGELHREDGPAREWANGSKEWWINGQELTEKEFNQRTSGRQSYKEMTVAQLEQILGHKIKIVKG